MAKSSRIYKFRQIYIEITRKCNLNCPFCPSVSNRDPILTDNCFSEIISKIGDFSDDFYLHILGEPLTNVLISKYFLIAEKYGKKIRITTNGTLLKSKKEELLSANSLDRINISLQAWKYLEPKKVEEYLDDLVDFIKEKRVRKPKLTVSLRFWNDKEDPSIIEFNNSLISKLEAKLGIKLDNNHPETYLLVSNEDEFIWPELDHEENNEFSYCLGGKSQLGILLNGDVVLCCLDHRGHTKLGNIYNNTLEEILNGEIFQNHLKMLENKEYYFELCKKCTFRNRFL